jgi:hypothetical protein
MAPQGPPRKRRSLPAAPSRQGRDPAAFARFFAGRGIKPRIPLRCRCARPREMHHPRIASPGIARRDSAASASTRIRPLGAGNEPRWRTAAEEPRRHRTSHEGNFRRGSPAPVFLRGGR